MPLPIDPLTLGAIGQGVIGGVKSIFGASQAAKARKRLKQIEKERPKGYIPSAILERANEPVAEEYMEAQEMGAQRRTSQGIGALSQGGSRAILGGLPSLTENERVGEMERAGMYEQERRRALADKGNAQERIRQEGRQDWQNKMNAQTAQLGAGTQNIFTGLEDIGEASLFYGLGKKDAPTGGTEEVKSEEVITPSGSMGDARKSPMFQGDVMGFSGELPSEVDAEFIKLNPMLATEYYKDPLTGKFIKR